MFTLASVGRKECTMMYKNKQEERREVFSEKCNGGKKGYNLFILKRKGEDRKSQYRCKGERVRITGQAKLLYENKLYSFSDDVDDSLYLVIAENKQKRIMVDVDNGSLQIAFDYGFETDNSDDFALIFYAEDGYQEHLYYINGFDDKCSCVHMYKMQNGNALYNAYSLMEIGMEHKVSEIMSKD